MCGAVCLLGLENRSCPNSVFSHGFHYSKADLSGLTVLVWHWLERLCCKFGPVAIDVQLGLNMRGTQAALNLGEH